MNIAGEVTDRDRKLIALAFYSVFMIAFLQLISPLDAIFGENSNRRFYFSVYCIIDHNKKIPLLFLVHALFYNVSIHSQIFVAVMKNINQNNMYFGAVILSAIKSGQTICIWQLLVVFFSNINASPVVHEKTLTAPNS